MRKIRAFTLLELMVTVVIVSILTAIAIPLYSRYIERRDLAVAKQEALRIAAELERFKSKNFSYKGFDASYMYTYAGSDGVAASYYDNTTGKLQLPLGATSDLTKYTITLVSNNTGHNPLTIVTGSDGNETTESASVDGLSWVMSVERKKILMGSQNSLVIMICSLIVLDCVV